MTTPAQDREITAAQRRLLLRAVGDRLAGTQRDGWHAVNPSEFSVCKALFAKGLIEMTWGRGAHRQIIRPTAAGRAAVGVPPMTTITVRPALRPAEIATIRAEADRASRALCLRELRFWRRYATPVDPVADAALAAYQGRLDHLRRLDLAVALTRLQQQ